MGTRQGLVKKEMTLAHPRTGNKRNDIYRTWMCISMTFLEPHRHVGLGCVCVCVLSHASRRERVPPGGCTHGPVIISTGRSQEMHFTRSNSFLGDTQWLAVAPQPGSVRPLPPGAVLRGGCRSVSTSGPELPSTSYTHWPGPTLLSFAGPC